MLIHKHVVQVLMILRAGQGDLPEILELQRAAFKEEAGMVGDPNIRPMTQTLEEMEAEYEHGTVFLKFVEEGKIIGSVRAYREGDTCHIGRLVVDPHHWRKGIGTKLIQAIENEFQGVSRFELYTRIDQPRSRPFYCSLGYMPFKTVKVSDSFTFVYLEKRN